MADQNRDDQSRSGKVRIKAKVEGVERSKVPIKVVVYTEEKEEVKILAEKAIAKDAFQLDLGIVPRSLPETVKVALVPAEVKSGNVIRRMCEAEIAPTATLDRELAVNRGGVLDVADLPFRSVDKLSSIWPLKRRVCGRVVKKDPVTGDVCYVPGATVRVLDVDFHLLWWYPYPGHPFGWFFPFWIRRREEIASTKTDSCGNFCVDIPYFDIDAILRWRLRFRCLWEILRPPRVSDAIDLGVKPDVRFYKELESLPELIPKPRPRPEPGPIIQDMPLQNISLEGGTILDEAGEAGTTRSAAELVSEFYTDPQFELLRREVLGKQALFEPVESDKLSVLESPAFPESIAAPALPDDDMLLKVLPDQDMLPEGVSPADMIPAIRSSSSILRLLYCWPEFIPEWRLFLDIPDIVFKVEQDIDGDGDLETIYDQGYLDVNWNLSDPTMNVIINAWSNAICVPCAPKYKPCTKTGLVGINEMAVSPIYLSSKGYAKRVNRPKPNGIRPEAETPFCKTLRLVGCPYYKGAKYYKVFYKHKGQPETHFKESWYVYHISAGSPHHVVPDIQGFYTVLTPPDDYFPYHTLINWPTWNYPNGPYEVRLSLYNASKGNIGPALPPIDMVLDNSTPSRADFVDLYWKVDEPGATWHALPLNCPVIKRPAGKDIKLRITYNAAATHLRDYVIQFLGCGLLNPVVDSKSYWHKHVNDNNKLYTWEVSLPHTSPEGAYRFRLEVRSRAFNALGGLASNWYFDPLHIWRVNSLPIAIING